MAPAAQLYRPSHAPAGVDVAASALSYVTDIRAIAATAAFGTLLYRLYRDRALDLRRSHSLFVQRVTQHLEQPFQPPDLILDMPLFPRAYDTELNTFIARSLHPCYVCLVDAAMRSGKSTVVQQYCKGRRRVLSLGCREQKLTAKYLAAEMGFGVFYEDALSLEDVFDVFKKALQQLAPDSGPIPLVLIDDFHYAISESGQLDPHASQLLEFLLEMKSNQLLNLMIITPEASRVRDLILGRSAQTSWIDVIEMGDVPSSLLRKALMPLTNSEEQAAYMVKKLGCHLGSVEDVLRRRSYSRSQTIYEIVDALVEEQKNNLIRVLMGSSRSNLHVSHRDWFVITKKLFDLLSVHKTAGVLQLAEESSAPLLTVMEVVRELSRLNFLHTDSFDGITWAIPMQQAASVAALESPLVKRLEMDLVDHSNVFDVLMSRHYQGEPVAEEEEQQQKKKKKKSLAADE